MFSSRNTGEQGLAEFVQDRNRFLSLSFLAQFRLDNQNHNKAGACSMLCTRCATTTGVVETSLHLEQQGIIGNAYRLDCVKCGSYIAAKLSDTIIDIDDVNPEFGDVWKEVSTNQERLCYYILCQITYAEVDTPKAENLETSYDLAGTSDIVILGWHSGKAIGFYTVKPKGTEVTLMGERHTMPVVDTVYIRSSYRHRGFGLGILFDVIKRFPNEDIGFSKPISRGMLGVLKKFLKNCKEYRLRFWEVADCDVGVSQQLIWFNMKNVIP